MPATKDGRCWACVQRRQWYTEEVGTAKHGGLRHYTVPAGRLCEQPRRGRSARPEAMREYQLRYRTKAKAADPEGWRTKQREKARVQSWRKRYGMTPEQYADRLAAQGGACAICGTTEPGGRGRGSFHVDHDHTTGQVRGLLCCPCNLMLGHASDNPDRLRQGAAYLTGAAMPEPLTADQLAEVTAAGCYRCGHEASASDPCDEECPQPLPWSLRDSDPFSPEPIKGGVVKLVRRLASELA